MNDSIGLYLNDIGKVPLLTAEDERELSRIVEAGREATEQLANGKRGVALKDAVAAAADAKDRFIRANLRLVVSIARRYPLPHGMDLPRPDPGGQPRPGACRRQVRLAARLQVLDLCHVLDSPGNWPSARPEGQFDPDPRRPLRQPPGRAAAGLRRRRNTRQGQRRIAPPHHYRSRSTRGWVTTATPRSAT